MHSVSGGMRTLSDRGVIRISRLGQSHGASSKSLGFSFAPHVCRWLSSIGHSDYTIQMPQLRCCIRLLIKSGEAVLFLIVNQRGRIGPWPYRAGESIPYGQALKPEGIRAGYRGHVVGRGIFVCAILGVPETEAGPGARLASDTTQRRPYPKEECALKPEETGR